MRFDLLEVAMLVPTVADGKSVNKMRVDDHVHRDGYVAVLTLRRGQHADRRLCSGEITEREREKL